MLPVTLFGSLGHHDRIFIVPQPRMIASCPVANDLLPQQRAASQKRIDFRLQKIGSKAFLNHFCKPNSVQEGFLHHFAETKNLSSSLSAPFCGTKNDERSLLQDFLARELFQDRHFNHFSKPKTVKEGFLNRFREQKIMKEGLGRHLGGTCKPSGSEGNRGEWSA